MSAEVTKLVPTRPDAEVAQQLREQLVAALQGVFAVMDEAKAAGFVASFNIGPDWQGKSSLTLLKIVKEY